MSSEPLVRLVKGADGKSIALKVGSDASFELNIKTLKAMVMTLGYRLEPDLVTADEHRGAVETDPEYRAVHVLLHQLWTKDVGTEGYDKSKWKELDKAILRLARRGT